MPCKGFRKSVRIPLIVLGGILAFLLLVMTVAQIFLSPKVCTALINKYAPALVDGEFSMQSASVSLFRRFPAVSAKISGLVVTYPADRFDESEKSGIQDLLTYSGTARNGSDRDTLASFDHFMVSVSIPSLLKGTLRIKRISLSKPHLFIHRYADGHSNLEVLKLTTSDSPGKDTTASSAVPLLAVRKLRVKDKVCLVYSSQADSLAATVLLKRMSLDGELSFNDMLESSFDFNVDSLLLAGKYKADTLLFGVNSLALSSDAGDMDLSASSSVMLASDVFGRLRVPVTMNGGLSIHQPSDGPVEIEARDFNVNVATVGINANATVRLAQQTEIKGKVNIPCLDIQKLIDDYASNLYPPAKQFSTNARISASADIDGWYDSNTGSLPSFDIKLNLPQCFVKQEKLGNQLDVSLQAEAYAGQGEPINVNVSSCSLAIPGMDLQAKADISSINGEDPGFDLDASLKLALDKMDEMLSPILGVNMSGNMAATLKGKCHLSELKISNFSKIKLQANAGASDLRIKSPDNALDVYVDTLTLKAGMFKDKAFTCMVGLDSVFLKSGESALVHGSKVYVLLSGASRSVQTSKNNSFNPMIAAVSIEHARAKGIDSLDISVRKSKNRLTIFPSEDSDKTPVFKLESKTGRIRMSNGPHRLSFKDMNMYASCRNKVITGRPQRKHKQRVVDSAYLATHEWLQEADFAKSDIKLDMGEVFQKFWANSELQGGASITKVKLSTPAYPLIMDVSGVKASFNSDKASLDSLHFKIGSSDLDIRGSLNKLKRFISGRGSLKMNLGVDANSLEVQQLLWAYGQGRKNMSSNLDYLSDVSDESYDLSVASHIVEEEEDTTSLMFVVPANIDATLDVNGRNVHYSNMNISDFSSKISMRHRCVQIIDTKALSNIGNVYLNAFYSTISKRDIKAGFDLMLEKVSANQAIHLVPQIDTLMPLLKNFDGLLNCNIAAVTQLDTNMNILIPSIDGVLRFSGKNLTFAENKEFSKMAKLLMLKDPAHSKVDSMKVEGVVKNSSVEIFPFVLKLDKWEIALAGVQNLDQSFRYHASILKAPLLVKFGANLYGDNFDKMKFSLGKPVYKDANKLPVFSKEIDATRINLATSIKNIFDKGVEKAIQENADKRQIEKARERTNYDHSVALDKLEESDQDSTVR